MYTQVHKKHEGVYLHTFYVQCICLRISIFILSYICSLFAVFLSFFNIHTIYKNALWIKNLFLKKLIKQCIRSSPNSVFEIPYLTSSKFVCIQSIRACRFRKPQSIIKNDQGTYKNQNMPTFFSSCCALVQYTPLALILHLHWNFFNSLRYRFTMLLRTFGWNWHSFKWINLCVSQGGTYLQDTAAQQHVMWVTFIVLEPESTKENETKQNKCNFTRHHFISW